MLTEFPPFYHSGEDIHEHCDVNEASFESDVGDIAYPDLIASADVKSFESIDPRLCLFKRVRGLTGTPFD